MNTPHSLRSESKLLLNLDNIRKAVEKLEDLGDIKCNIPECGDVSCASTIIYNAITEAEINIQNQLELQKQHIIEELEKLRKKSFAIGANSEQMLEKTHHAGRMEAINEVIKKIKAADFADR